MRMTKIAKTATFKAIAMSELITTDAGIKKAVTSIAKRGRALQRDIHIVACSVLQRISVHNDVRLAADCTMLFDALPGSLRTNALRDWFAAYGPIAWEKNKAKFVKDKPVELTKAMLDPFWEFAPEPEYKPLDIMQFINAAIKKVQKDAKETGVDHTKVILALEAAKKADEPVVAVAPVTELIKAA